MKPKQFNAVRLVKYARYLQADDLKCKKLFAAVSNVNAVDELVDNGTLRPLIFLPIMEIPMIFPNEWRYDKTYMPFYLEDKTQETLTSVIEFFGINRYIFYHIWSPGAQRPELYGGKKLGPKPTMKQIASNILDLVDVIKYYENIKGSDTPILLN